MLSGRQEASPSQRSKSQLYLQSSGNYLTSLYLSPLICKMRIPHGAVIGIKGVHFGKVLGSQYVGQKCYCCSC